jgi:hypothetical protein
VDLITGGTAASTSLSSVQWFYGNARGLRQASGDMCQQMSTARPEFFGITEAHIKGDPIKPPTLSGYKKVARLDRTNHGGGLLIATRSHLLVNDISKKACIIQSGGGCGDDWSRVSGC